MEWDGDWGVPIDPTPRSAPPPRPRPSSPSLHLSPSAPPAFSDDGASTMGGPAPTQTPPPPRPILPPAVLEQLEREQAEQEARVEREIEEMRRLDRLAHGQMEANEEIERAALEIKRENQRQETLNQVEKLETSTEKLASVNGDNNETLAEVFYLILSLFT